MKRGIAKILLDVRRGDGPPAARHWTFPALVTTTRLLEEHPDIAAGAVRAIVKTQQALRAEPQLAAKAAQRLFPAEEASLIAFEVTRDLPFYDATITEEMVAHRPLRPRDGFLEGDRRSRTRHDAVARCGRGGRHRSFAKPEAWGKYPHVVVMVAPCRTSSTDDPAARSVPAHSTRPGLRELGAGHARTEREPRDPHDRATECTLQSLSDIGGRRDHRWTCRSRSSPLERAINDALLAHRIVVFRDQRLSAAQQHALTLSFGEIEGNVRRLPSGERLPVVHTVHNLDEYGQPTAAPDAVGNYSWHTDKSYHAEPSLLTMLHARAAARGVDTHSPTRRHRRTPPSRDSSGRSLLVVAQWEASRRHRGRRQWGGDPRAPARRDPLVPSIRPGEKARYLGNHASPWSACRGQADAAGPSARARDRAALRLLPSMARRRPGDLGQPLPPAPCRQQL